MSVNAAAIRASRKIADIEPILLLVGGAAVIYLVWSATKKVGEVVSSATDTISPGAKTEKIDDSVLALRNLESDNPFNPQYMLTRKEKNKGKANKYLNSATKKQWSKKIYSEYAPDFGSSRVFAPGEKVIMDILKQIKTKNQLSDLAYFYNDQYKRDMLTDIQDGLKASGWTNYTYSTKMQPIVNFVKALPA